MGNNLNSSITVTCPIDINNLKEWFMNEIYYEPTSIKNILSIVYDNIDDFIKWPQKAILLWNGADRIPDSGKKLKYHKYPDLIKKMGIERGIKLDSCPNGPAITAFLFALGVRPKRIGSTNSWNIHHLYSGKFFYPRPLTEPLHAIKNEKHFTQSAGLVAVHPLIDALFDEIPAIAWLFRYEAFLKFGYDPMKVFSENFVNDLGFINESDCEVIF